MVNRSYRPDVVLAADHLRPQLLPPMRRRRGERADAKVQQLEKDIGAQKAVPCEMIVAMLFDRQDRGDSTVYRYPLALFAMLLARQAQREQRSVDELFADLAREQGEAFAALAMLDPNNSASLARAAAEMCDVERATAQLRVKLTAQQIAPLQRVS